MHERVRRVVSYCADNGVKAIDCGDGTFRIYKGRKYILKIQQDSETIEDWLDCNCDIIAQLSESVVTEDD